MIDIIIFVIAFGAYFILHRSGSIDKFISDFTINSRIKSLRNNRGSGALMNDDDDDNESIGLSKKGPMFSSALYNKIASINPQLIEEMQFLLLKAGKREDGDLENMMRSKINSIIMLFFIITIYSLNAGVDPLMTVAAAILGSIIIGHKLTNMQVEMIAEKRLNAINNGIPDLIDLLVICTESGLDLSRSIRRIAREMRTSNPILADELSLTSIELEMIPDQKLVFANLDNRTNCESIKTISKTLSQSIEYGSSLSDSLKDLSTETKQRRMLDAETKAAQVPALLTLPMMLFTMPCLFIVMLGPVILSVIKSFK